ncbi:hypothetical protein BTVI_150833 [Pitangus sulphuratus]|nr:hypothetical protein BTVI_150833 [Pitangus sulphuratus]
MRAVGYLVTGFVLGELGFIQGFCSLGSCVSLLLDYGFREPYFKGNLLVQPMNMWKIHCYALMIFRWAIVAENHPKSSSFSIVAPNHFGIALLIAALE